MSDRWYFAYGSNLSTDQKENRTGHIREARLARIAGYRIAFNKRGSDGTGKANIVRDGGQKKVSGEKNGDILHFWWRAAVDVGFRPIGRPQKLVKT